jgi:maltose/moltooligosaccharide transporter
MPFLLLGIPIAALFFALIPFHNSLATLIVFMICMNLAMSIFRSPTIALMPDITPESKRTKANGVIKFMGGCGAILAFSAGSLLFGIDESIPFLAVSAVFFIALWVIFRNIKENRDAIPYIISTTTKINYKTELNAPTIFLLAALFFWFIAIQGMEALFTLYGVNELGLKRSFRVFISLFFIELCSNCHSKWAIRCKIWGEKNDINWDCGFIFRLFFIELGRIRLFLTLNSIGWRNVLGLYKY